MQSESQKVLARGEVEDEYMFSSHDLQLLKFITIGFIGLVLLTAACIWLKDFRNDSTFSTITGRMETRETKSE